MGASQRLRMCDVTAVYRLADECRQLAADPRVWQNHMLRGLIRITDCQIGTCGEVVPSVNGLASDLETALDVGRQSEQEQQRAMEFLSSGEYPQDEFCLRLAQRFVRSPLKVMTRFRSQLVDDSEWFRSETCAAYRVMGMADTMIALTPIPETNRVLAVGLARVVGEEPVGLREAQVLELFCTLMMPALGHRLARMGEPGIAELSPRRRQVLAGLLDGLAEKQIARQLELRLPTVHEHVTDLYRHFGVSSRGELMALFLRRHHGPVNEWIKQFHLNDPSLLTPSPS